MLPVVLALTRYPADSELLAFLIFLAGFILYNHRGNVARLLRGEENRMSGLMILRRPR